MADLIHFPKISIAKSGIRAEIDLRKYGKRLPTAQWFLGETVLASCRVYMPMQTGILRNSSHTEAKGRRVVFPGPAARMLYMGKKMVDSETGKGPRKVPTGAGGEYVLRFRAGAKLKATNENLKLTHGNKEAQPQWFEYAKTQHLKDWVQSVKKILLGGK